MGDFDSEGPVLHKGVVEKQQYLSPPEAYLGMRN